MINKLLFTLLLFSVGALAQDAPALKGKVISGKSGVPKVYVINKNTGVETTTNDTGDFTIQARPGDAIVVYSTNIMVREFILNSDSFKNSPYTISVNYSAEELDEVVITKYGKITSESLGIVPENQVRYTVAERRLFEAGYGSIGIGALINVITGRMAKLKRAAASEKQVFMLEGLRGYYYDEDITERFKIPEEHIEGFMYFLAEKKDFGAIVKQGNWNYIDFLMIGYAKDYLKLQQSAP